MRFFNEGIKKKEIIKYSTRCFGIRFEGIVKSSRFNAHFYESGGEYLMHLESKSIYLFLEKLFETLQKILCEIETIDLYILDIYFNAIIISLFFFLNGVLIINETK